ncbi:MAG: hypothetical protein AAF514_19075, partial [Verrucomicrobiota bacterium]
MKGVPWILVVLLLGLNVWQYLDRKNLEDAGVGRSAPRGSVEKTTASAGQDRASILPVKEARPKAVGTADAETAGDPVLAPPDGKKTAPNPMKGMAEAMKNPGMRELMKAQQKATLDTQYGRLYENLSLEGEELEHFQKMITDAEMVKMEKGLQMFSGEVTPEERQKLAEEIGASQSDDTERLDRKRGAGDV